MNQRNWKFTRKNHSLVVLTLFLLQHHLHIILVAAASNVHIVYLGEKKHDDPDATKKSHYELLSHLLGSKEAAKRSIVYSYRHGFSGFAARLSEAEAQSIAEFPEVVEVIPNTFLKLQTTRSWDFIGVHQNSPQNVLTENLGKGTIIGVIDTGVWPESKSFNDEGMAPIPSHWRGICQKEEKFNITNCNKKLIGARWFRKGLIEETTKTESTEYASPRDAEGHGTHTASTAAGNFVNKASYRGLATGLARGGAPRAHLAIYKACWADTGACSSADMLKAFDKAIHDGVDILSVSIGYAPPLFSYNDLRNAISIGSFHATAKGITVVVSAGNSGPISQTVENTAPWLITVAATTIDRAFPTAITLGNNQTFWGQSIDAGKNDHVFAGLTYSGRIALDPTDGSAKGCQPGSLNAKLAKGKIVVCFSTSYQQGILSASLAVLEAGGVGIIFAQFHDDGLESCGIPCVKVDYEVATQIIAYIERARSPTAKLSSPNTVIGKRMSPSVASFSSRGPSSLTPEILKPDVAAPGVDILAAYPSAYSNSSHGYAFLSGSSMACPHVAGIASLIKSVHKDWSPAAIRSALVTTASQIGTDGTYINAEGQNRKIADPFDIGGGQVNPNKAVDPGLIFNVTTVDYIHYICSLGYSTTSITRLTKTKINCTQKSSPGMNLNLPSISIPNLKIASTVTVKRTVTNVGHFSSEYKAIVEAPPGIQMTVEPQILSFNSTNQNLSFKVSFYSTHNVQGSYKFGSLTWTDGKHLVRSPVAVRVIRFESYADI
ncbi:hypothetical protein UlMin_001665 [Ulmus minor]